MKKILVALVMLALVFGTASAQLKVGFSADVIADVFNIKSYSGDAESVTGQNTAGGALFTHGQSQLFTLSDFWDDNELRLKVTYTGEGFEAMVETKLDDLINPSGAFWRNGVSFNSMGQAFGEYYVKGTVGNFTGYVGNSNNRGAMNSYRFAFSDFLANNLDGMTNTNRSGPVSNNFGVQLPNFAGVRRGTSAPLASPTNGFGSVGDRSLIYVYRYDADNLRSFGTTAFANNRASLSADGSAADPALWYANSWKTYAAITANYSPFTVTIAGNVTDNSALDAGSTISGTLRVSGSKIADFITFDVLYKIVGYDPTTYYDEEVFSVTAANAGLKPDGMGRYQHTIGLYAGLDLIDKLPIAVGYTAYFPYAELVQDSYSSLLGPLFNGIDLRVRFTGIDKLDIKFTNNFSFSYIHGVDNEDMYQMFFTGTGTGFGPVVADFAQSYSESWFAMTNSLGLVYAIQDNLKANVELGNTVAVIGTHHDGTGDRDSYVTDTFGAAAFVSYNLGSNALLEGGLAFKVINNKFTTDVVGVDEYEYGSFQFGIPVRVKVAF